MARRTIVRGNGINLKTGNPISFTIPASMSSRGLESLKKNMKPESLVDARSSEQLDPTFEFDQIEDLLLFEKALDEGRYSLPQGKELSSGEREMLGTVSRAFAPGSRQDALSVLKNMEGSLSGAKSPEGAKIIPFPRDVGFKDLTFTKEELQEALIYKNVEDRLRADAAFKDCPADDFDEMVLEITRRVLSRKSEGGKTISAVMDEEIGKSREQYLHGLSVAESVWERLMKDGGKDEE